MTRETLLPLNRTAFEEAADLTGAQIGELPVDIRLLKQPYNIPEANLAWLSWGLSVDLWKREWPVEQKRVVTARSLRFHAIKGTQTAIEEALRIMDIEPRRFIVPPATTYMMNALTPGERERFLNRFAQLRIYPFVARGIGWEGAAFLGHNRGLGEIVAGPVNPVNLDGTEWTRTATLWDKGEETTLTFRTVTPESVGDFGAKQFDEVVLGAKPTAAIHLDAPPKAALYLIDDFSVRRRVVRVSRDVEYQYRLGREEYTTYYPDGDLIDVRPNYIAQTHPAQVSSLFPGQRHEEAENTARIIGAHLPPSIAWRYLYERWHIHDPDRIIADRVRSTHLGYTRLGMPPYHAEARVRIKGRQWPRTTSTFVGGYFVKADQSKIEDARQAVNVARSLRDKVWIDTKTYRWPQVGDRLPYGSINLGEFIGA
jgi:hypothetical protein